MDRRASTDSTDGAQQPASQSTNRAGAKDLWTLIKEEKQREKKTGDATKDALETGVENNLLVCGMRGAGKTTIINKFLEKEESCTPTVGLEYTFGRRTKGINNVKDVVHIWELAGGTFLSDLLTIPVTETNIHTFTALIVLDLSNPALIFPSLLHFMTKIQDRVNAICENLDKRGSKRPKGMKSFAMKKYSNDHDDKELVKPVLMNLVVVGNKYDAIREMEPEKRKLLVKGLRYICHTYGASLVFTSNKTDTETQSKLRSLLVHHAFNAQKVPTKVLQGDYKKPVFITAGSDSYTSIGGPPSETRSASGLLGFKENKVVSMSVWQNDWEVFFGKGDLSLDGVRDVRAELSKFPESTVDRLRLLKDEELERLRKSNERKIKEKEQLKGLGIKKEKTTVYSRARASGMASQ